MDALDSIMLRTIGATLDDMRALDQGRVDQHLRNVSLQLRYNNAAKDFITAVLRTTLIQTDEDRIRVLLIRIVHLLEGHIQHHAVRDTDEEFDRFSQRVNPLAYKVLLFLRCTASDVSGIEQSRMTWAGYASGFIDNLQPAFEDIVQSAREELT